MKKTLVITSCASVVITIILLLTLFKLHPSLSQYYSEPIGKYIFVNGFIIASLGFLTHKHTMPLFISLVSLVMFDTYQFEIIHNLFAIVFFGYANYLLIKAKPNIYGYVMLLTWIIAPISLLIFEVISIGIILTYFASRVKYIRN